MNANKGWLASLTGVLLIGGILVLLLGGLAALCLSNFDTQYAPGYSEKKFRSIKLGDSEQLVISLLGQPYATDNTKPYLEWIYSADKQRSFSRTGRGVGTHTVIRFDGDGRVVSVGGMVQTSASTFTFGDGLNYLKLTKAQIDRLEGSNQDEIKKQFGAPVATYEDKTSRLLRYSRSPSSANYHLRAIGLDSNGEVVHIWREIYWD